VCGCVGNCTLCEFVDGGFRAIALCMSNVRVCVYVCQGGWGVCIFVCVFVRERESKRERERVNVFVCVCVCCRGVVTVNRSMCESNFGHILVCVYVFFVRGCVECVCVCVCLCVRACVRVRAYVVNGQPFHD